MISKNETRNHSLWKKRRKRKFNKAFILLIVLVYIVSRTTPILTENPNRFHTITHGTLEDVLSFEGIILRDEQVLTTNSSRMTVESGQRVAKGQEISAGLHSPKAGTITKGRDGFEEDLNISKVLQKPENHLGLINEILNKEVVEAQEGLRLVEGFHWGAVGVVSTEASKEIQSGRRVWIEGNGQRVRGRIAWIQERENGEDSYILVRSNEYFEGIYDHRKLDFTLIKREVEGLSVPINAIYYENGVSFVTQRKAGNNLKVPVNIILSDEEIAILSADRFRDSEGEIQSTVSIYDEVLLNQGNGKGKEELNE